jgi:excisionase family DNA binding protein
MALFDNLGTSSKENQMDTATADERRTLSIEEAAEVLGVGRSLMYDAAKRGEIPVIKIGRRLVVPRARLEALLAGENYRSE